MSTSCTAYARTGPRHGLQAVHGAAFYARSGDVRRRARVDAGDFRLMSRATVDAVNALPEHGRVLRLVVPALGFPSAAVNYARAARAAGDSKYPLGKMIRLSVDGVTGFSIAPLRFATWLGLLGGLAALGVLVYALVAMLLGDTCRAGRRRSSSWPPWGRSAAGARHPWGVRRPHLRRAAGAPVVLRGPRLAGPRVGRSSEGQTRI